MYKCIQFTDKGKHTGNLFYVGTPSQDLIEELDMDTSGGAYYTSLQNIIEKGWTLQFVTPCGLFLGGSSHMIKGGPIENSYIFLKLK